MSEIADFLRARYLEAKDREQQKCRVIPSPFDGHEVEFRGVIGSEELYVDGHPYPIEKWRQFATEPAPDPTIVADLDAKLFMLTGCERAIEAAKSSPENADTAKALDVVDHLLRYFAAPFAGHPDHKGEQWAP